MAKDSTQDQQGMVYKAFSPLQPGEPTKYDPSGQEHIYADVPWRVGARALGRLRHKEYLGDTYVRGGLSRGGYVRNTTTSTLED